MRLPELDSATIDRIVEMAWEDRTPFEAIETQFGLTEPQVIKLMRREMKTSKLSSLAQAGHRPTHQEPQAPRLHRGAI